MQSTVCVIALFHWRKSPRKRASSFIISLIANGFEIASLLLIVRILQPAANINRLPLTSPVSHGIEGGKDAAAIE
jgi:hypothetical protein